MDKKLNVIKKIFRKNPKNSKSLEIEGKIGYSFKNKSLLKNALVHRSWNICNDLPYTANNERLEFLGDSVLNMLVTEHLYKTKPDATEGEMSKSKSVVVSGHALAQTAQLWSLGKYLYMDKGEARMGGRQKENILADAFEAVLGAVYLDSGISAVRVILERFHFPRIASILKDSEFVNYKSLLIEWMQSHSLQPPEYVVVNESGPGHQKVFETEVLLNGKVYGKGIAVSKKKAEQEAAAVALQKVQQEGIHET